jgi:hypothetical protein
MDKYPSSFFKYLSLFVMGLMNIIGVTLDSFGAFSSRAINFGNSFFVIGVLYNEKHSKEKEENYNKINKQ